MALLLVVGWSTALFAADSDSLALLGAQATEGAAAGYVKDKVCATCHPQKWESYQHVGMAQSFKRPADAKPMEDFGREYYHEASQRYYQMTREDGGILFRRYQRDKDGGIINEIEIPVAWVLGSGNRARSYLYQTEWGELYLLPIGWYSESNSWRMSPGYEEADHPGINRRIERNCMFCHNAYPEVPTGSDGHLKSETFPHNLPDGTGCQRCHGPGAEHIKNVTSGSGIEAIRAAIVNPVRLSSEARDSVCFQCHMLPAASIVGARRFGRGEYSFRPGQKLSDYMLHVDITEREVEPGERFEINHHGYRFWQSRCYQESKGALACISCHDPHEKPESAGFEAETCITCHMPQRRTSDAIHVTMTDHRIATGPFELDELIKPLKQESRTVSGVGLLKLGDTPGGEEAVAYRMIAALRAGRSLETAEHELDRVLRIKGYADPTPYLDLARAQMQLGQFKKAGTTVRRLMTIHKDLPAAYNVLGVSLMAQGQEEQAIAPFKRSLELQPDPETHFNLAAVYLGMTDNAAAEEQLDAALGLRPYMAVAWKYKAMIYAAGLARTKAREAYIRSLQIEPLDTPLYNELATLLHQMGEHDEAERYLELGTRIYQSLLQPAVPD